MDKILRLRLDLFSFLNRMQNQKIEEMTGEALAHFPDYFWVLPCSTSGKHHGGELLVEHVITCCNVLVNSVWKQVNDLWDPITKDLALSAMILHDGWRCGFPGREKFLHGKLCTDNKHPEIGAETLRQIWSSSDNADEDFANRISEMVEWHYGPWGVHKKEFLDSTNPLPWWDPRIMIHTIDAHNAWNSSEIAKLSAK